MTETTTPSVEGDRLEAIAAVVADAIEKAVALSSGPEVQAKLASVAARQIDALPCKGGEAVAWRWRAAGHEDAWCYTDVKARAYGFSNPDAWTVEPLFATPTTEPDTVRGLREALEAMVAVAENPSLDGDAAYEAARQALAALSDTPSGRLEK